MSLPGLSAVVRPCIASPVASEWIFTTCRRHQSSYRRTRKALKVKPDASFAPTKVEKQEHIIFNPPSSIPSVYHTPSKFLPPDDPRRIAAQVVTNIPSASRTGAGALTQAERIARLPKPVDRVGYEKKAMVTPDQVEEIRKLRTEDPRYWTRVRLAEKFGCSSMFISLCAKSKEASDRHLEQLERIKARWGKKRREAREDRAERQKLWGRD